MIVVVGAGPAGLAMAAELARRGMPYRVLERQSVGYAWQQHYDRLCLHSLKQISALPGLPMPASYPDFPSRAQFLAYLQGYAEQFALRIEQGVTLLHADYAQQRWQLDTSGGMIQAETLVMATGIWSAPVRPTLPGEAQFGGTILHSCAYRNPQQFAGQRVLVVGVGNSGSEIALDLAEAGIATTIAVRSGVAFGPKLHSASVARITAWLLRTLPRQLAAHLIRRRDFRSLGLPLPPGSPLDHLPVVGYQLPEAVAAGRIAIRGAVAGLEPQLVRLSDGSRIGCDAIILATGYRPAIAPIADLVELDPRGRPLVDRFWRARSNPYLVCIGYHYPTTEGWLQALGRVVRAAADGIEAQRIPHTDG
jgi:cation diffusion facilitator CzcD-associated flavoprotein CzcO